MALSQIQCLDDHHVNWRVSEGKPEFFYSEDQRLALEELISRGRDAFTDYLREHSVREFLSEPEQEWLARTAEAYRPGSEHQGASSVLQAGEDAGEGAISLQYWPDRSEGSIPDLDLGWPESASYRGVTRVNVHTQPPADGHTHIKEVVRKTIAQAQKVIAVVMDVFTDVDIFKDLLDMAFKKKVPVYIIIDTGSVPSFLAMCDRADMHRGHLKNLRVRCSGGVEFYTRSAQKVRGSLSQRFMFVDGDRAISGSYSFTWAASRLDCNLITAMTGQAVETFDKQFRDLYLTSRGVSLAKVKLANEPTPDPTPQAPPAPPSAAVARKLINPKYALVTAQAANASPVSSGNNSSNMNSSTQNAPARVLKGRVREPEAAPPLHPGLAHLEKAYLIPYLPVWPEPDPPSDVIGFINVRDPSRPDHAHLQRSQRFETSQAIRFSSPFTPPPPAPLPEKACPRNAQPQAAPARAAQPQVDAPPPQPPHPLREEDTLKDGARLPPPQSPAPPAGGTSPPPPLGADPPAAPPPAPLPPPPVAKPRTLQLLISPPSDRAGQPQVSVVRRSSVGQEMAAEERRAAWGGRGRDDSSQDDAGSTTVLCDRTAADAASNLSTTSDEYYECSDAETAAADPLTNGGVTAGSGRAGEAHRHGDGVNMMARFSQSMLDLRPHDQPQERETWDYRPHQQQQHRHIGQLFKGSTSPARDARLSGAKVVIAKPGSYHRPARASGPVIGGHRYWQGQSLQPPETRSGRSPQRHGMAYKQGGGSPGRASPRRVANPVGVSYTKLNNLRHTRGTGVASQKKDAS